MVLVAPRDPLRPNSDASARWERETHFLGRGFGDRKEKQALIKSWIDLCLKDHGEVCCDNHGTHREFKKLIGETYFGVIDVADMQLKSLPVKDGTPEPYIALSYVWGRKAQEEPPYVTTRLNVMTHILHGGIETAWDKLPRTIQDAILLVSRLGYRYLWIDSLCIVQDSHSSWQLNADAMHLVYGNAHFTICAADGDDSSVGLRAATPVVRAMYPAASTKEAMASLSETASQDDQDSQPMTADCGPGVRLMITRPLEAVVSDSAWNKRAWTFQERILSRRCLVFAEGRAYWQCRSTNISQDIHTDGNNKGWSLDRINSPLRTLGELKQRPLWFYMSYISMYTGRLLTKQRDILAAFQGISWLLERHMDTPFLFGLPASHFDLALLWVPLEKLKQRKARRESDHDKRSCTVDELGNCTCHADQESFGGLEFPTWSWSGWMGARSEYQSGMLDDCLQNVHEWLTKHTWIQWHIRDERGHLQPLWEILFQKTGTRSLRHLRIEEEAEVDARWKGYSVQCRQGPPSIDVAMDNRRYTARQSNRIVVANDYDPVHRRRNRSKDKEDKEDWAYYEEVVHVRPRERIATPSPPRSSRRRPRRLIHSSPQPDSYSSQSVRRRSRDRKSPSPVSERSQSTESQLAEVRAMLKVLTAVVSRRRRSPSPEPSKDSTEDEQVTSDSSSSEAYTLHRGPNTRIITRERPVDAASDAKGTHTDKYGRTLTGDIPQEDENKFQAILPDNPFGVIWKRPSGRKKNWSQKKFMPILQFWTWRTELHIVIRDSDMDSTKQSDTGLCQCDIVDKNGDWCGSIVLDEKWIHRREAHIFSFIAISEAKRFTDDECPVWTYYIPKERDESEWDLYYVLLLERNVERGLWERAGLGKVFQAAFREKTWAEIKLG
ncbi:hypothetical protein AWENTII_002109 [Aspergillus wentii]